jgi:hypothetical protein
MATTWPAASSILETPQCAVPASPPAVVSRAGGSVPSCRVVIIVLLSAVPSDDPR